VRYYKKCAYLYLFTFNCLEHLCHITEVGILAVEIEVEDHPFPEQPPPGHNHLLLPWYRTQRGLQTLTDPRTTAKRGVMTSVVLSGVA